MESHSYKSYCTLEELSSIDESWLESIRRGRTEPEERLMLALLYNGIKQFLRGADEARRWIMEPNYGRDPVFTFDYICDHFDIDATRLRTRFIQRREGTKWTKLLREK